MRDTLKKLRAAAWDAGYADRDMVASVLTLVGAAGMILPHPDTDEAGDQRDRVLVLMFEAFYVEGWAMAREEAERFGYCDFDADTACREWVKRLARIALN
jgi:hypothetical protein